MLRILLVLLRQLSYTMSTLTMLYQWHALSFIHSGHFYSTPSSPLLLRGTPDYSTDTVSEFHTKAQRQLQAKNLPKVPTWRLERESNPRPSGWKSSSQPRRHHVPRLFYQWEDETANKMTGTCPPLPRLKKLSSEHFITMATSGLAKGLLLFFYHKNIPDTSIGRLFSCRFL